jgi:dTDP-4-dehydrorhamnose reductase
MKILLTGTTGQVGWELQRTLMTVGDVISVGRNQLDLAKPDTICQTIRDVKPDLIVNPAAYTAVDKAESEPDLAMIINGIAPGIIAEEAQRIGAAIIHYSTDYVFDGNKNTPYLENDQPNPQNIYGKTKLAGEEAIKSVGVNYLIFRTSWVYGFYGKNFLLTMQKLAKERDQIGAPTWSRMIAEITAQIVSQSQQNPTDFFSSKGGLYHLSPSGKTSWYGFAKAIFNDEFPPKNERKLQRLIPITTPEYPTPAIRPAFSLLDHQKLSHTFGLKMPNWEQVLRLVLDI